MASLASGEPRATSIAEPAVARAVAGARLSSIDALRGLVMVIMLLDHVRETFFVHMQVADPVDARTVMPALFFSRLTSMICAPVFVGLTGLSAWLYGRRHSRAEVSAFLLKRGLFLMVLEVTFVGFAWSAQFPPQTLWLQVIWAIGISMVALAGLIHLPRPAVLTIGIAIVAGHNLLDGIVLAPGDTGFAPWAMVHQRAVFEFAGLTVKTTYPVLPWIGVIALGHALGPWFALEGEARRQRLMLLGSAMVIGFIVLRALNGYGDRPWFVVPDDGLRTVMSFLALTKYPPSLLYLLPTLGLGLILLAQFERLEGGRISHWLSVLGGAPMFFYLLHLYVLRVTYLIALAVVGPNQGTMYGFDSFASVWICYLILLVPLYFPTRWFSRLKSRRRDIWWLKYL
ncbi:heparan-alpha-glucosaminide N-acetyltransferase domain-containing protein [Sphingomonas sp. KR1UV-12]|uniref:Heparan-alpha-glucosaminide N-acetyltransferase domain-containing protein n=1 Tax=Sphingomonas aurea TaxID=3063994 RepID=A0ABT9ELR4_9SPHN|nr:heparan-alpha-glucosaminide N-acetyltransferase domain-containing protein [Sphingomonas sp. KR1UV-12]MDP1027578.1 heparan-alpha-glucosaminide N-acetyltransferase domain-containing protein [Sphingomonas sp. KR1UV-12]